MLKKVDAHHHLWDLRQKKHSWLIDEIEDSFIGDYSKIRNSYLIDNYLCDIKNQHVEKSVHIQAGWERIDSVGETKWLQSIADKYGYPHGIVAYADLTDAKVEKILQAHCQYRNMRGIRQILNWHQNHKYSGCSEDFFENQQWYKGYSLLSKYNLSFDMQVYPTHMSFVSQLASKYPDTQIIINHSGMPLNLTNNVDFAQWRNGLNMLAKHENVAIKISGLGMFDHEWTTSSIKPLVSEVIDIFGIEKCMFASNFPVDNLYSDYDTLFNAYQNIIMSFSKIEQEKLFYKNAERIYRI